jgi:hypothetical protein
MNNNLIVKLKSRMLRDVQYNPTHCTLVATFNDFNKYLYYEVTEQEYLSILSAESQGKAFNAVIKAKHKEYQPL